MANRRVRDIPCLLLLVLVWIAMLVVAGFGLRAGDPNRLFFGTDSLGNLCGVVNEFNSSSPVDLTIRPKLYVWNPLQLEGTATCEPSCPSELKVPDPDDAICTYATDRANMSALQLADYIAAGQCTPTLYPSLDILNRCIPLPPAGNSTTILQGSTVDFGAIWTWIRLVAQQSAVDIGNVWREIAWFSLLAAGLCVVWMGVLWVAVGAVVWVSVILLMLGLDALAIWLCIVWQGRKAALDQAIVLAGGAAVEGRLAFDANGTLTAFIISAVVAGVYTILVVFLRNRIRIAEEVIREATRAIAHTPGLFAVPALLFSLTAAAVAYFIWIAIYLWTAQGRPATFSVNLEGSNVIVWESYDAMKYTPYLHLFGALWTVSFLAGVYQCIVAGAVASWYFGRTSQIEAGTGRTRRSNWPVLSSFGDTVRYHLGSIALGSLLIAITQFLRFLVWKASAMAKKVAGKIPGYCFVRALFWVVDGILALLTRLLKLLTKYAYIEIAISGKSFFGAAARATGLLAQSFLRLLVTDCVSDFVLFAGKLLIAGITGLVAYAVFVTGGERFALQFWPSVVGLVAIESFVVAHVFMRVYRLVIDAVC